MKLDAYKNPIILKITEIYGLSPEEAAGGFTAPPNAKMGDIAFGCFEIAKRMRKSPNEIAREICGSMEHESFEKSEAVGPYANFFIRKDHYAKKVLGSEPATAAKHSKGKRMLVEYLSANPNKPLHIGQARNVSIGDSLVRCLRFLGNHVDAMNYGDDSGVNVGYNIVGHLFYGLPLESDKKFDHYCGDVYTNMRQRDEDSEFKDILSKTLLKIESAEDESINAIHKEYTRKCIKAQMQSCERMGAFFDLINWETDILHMNFFSEAIGMLKEGGHVRYETEGPNRGCTVIDLSPLDEFKNAEKKVQVLIKSDGVATYTGKDIAYALWKLGYLKKDFYYEYLYTQSNGQDLMTTSSIPNGGSYEYGKYETAISVIDHRQSLAQNVVKGSLKLLGYLGGEKDYTHLSYGVVYITPETLVNFGFDLSDEEKSKKRLPFSSRKGWYITIDDTMDRLQEKAFLESKKRNPDMDEAELKALAEKIALGAFRYFLISSGEDVDLTFDVNAALEMEGETGPYIMYAYARICNVMKKMVASEEQTAEISEADFAALDHDLGIDLVKRIDEFEDVLHSVEKALSPNLLAKYVYGIAKTFNSFYGKVRLLTDDPKTNRMNHLLLGKLRTVLKQSMNIIGIEEVERM